MTIALVIAACAPLAWRRRAPIAAVLVAVLVQAVLEWNSINGPSWLPLLIAMYSLGAYSSGRSRTVAAGVVAVIVGGLVVAGLLEDVIEVPEMVGAAASFAVPFVVGDNVRRRRNDLAELAERAERAERERELLAGQRVGEERTRIARDLHDVVAHSVSAMVIQAAAARRSLDRAPADAVVLLANIEETGRRTMTELRQSSASSATRRAVHAASPVQSIIDIESLVDSAADLDVRLSTAGAIDHRARWDRRRRPSASSRRRSPTPAVTPARTRRSTCGSSGTDDHLDVYIEDDGRGAAADRQQLGYGLIGMGERVAAFGGTLALGPPTRWRLARPRHLPCPR